MARIPRSRERGGHANPRVADELTDYRPILTIHEYEHHEAQQEALRRRRDREFRQVLRHARTFVTNDAAEEMVHLDNGCRSAAPKSC
jgi:hypothetical protein